MQRLIKSSKFWTLVLDVIVSLILFFVGKYGDASLFEDVKFVIVAIQPIFLMLIGSIAAEDITTKKIGIIYEDK